MLNTTCGPRRLPPAERFWPKVDTSGRHQVWLGRMHGKHGQFWVDARVAIWAELWAWEAEYGPIPDGMTIIRTCDEPRCVSTAHHYIGNEWDKRFWPNVDRDGPNDCWCWMGPAKNNGYGAFGAQIHGVRVSSAHKFSWLLHHGTPAAGKLILHTCDNRLCVNPAHLWLGTAKDNTADMMAKGRHRFHGLALGGKASGKARQKAARERASA